MQGALQHFVGPPWPDVDAKIEHLGRDGGRRESLIAVFVPPVPAVDLDGLLPRQAGDVEFRVLTLRDAILRLPARVPRVIDIAAFVIQDHLNSPPEALVHDGARAHIVTVTSLRLPLSRMCAGPKALGRYPLRSA